MKNEIANDDREITGIIFDFKRFATADGPGIRGLIFLKGCPLKCKWCSNPEGQRIGREVIYHKNRCVKCMQCLNNCPNYAIKENEVYGLVTDQKKCTICGSCVNNCMFQAREIIGVEITVSDLIKKIMRDKNFYDYSGGGVTLTGGEPLFQPTFSLEILKSCKKNDIHTAIETSGYVPWKVFNLTLPYLDLLFVDIKHIDSTKHKKYTGVGNELILNNIKNIDQEFPRMAKIIRIPFIPGFNSDEKTFCEIFEYISYLNTFNHVEVLPYHRFGINKYEGLGLNYELKNIEPVRKNDLGEKYNLSVQIEPQ